MRDSSCHGCRDRLHAGAIAAVRDQAHTLPQYLSKRTLGGRGESWRRNAAKALASAAAGITPPELMRQVFGEQPAPRSGTKIGCVPPGAIVCHLTGVLEQTHTADEQMRRFSTAIICCVSVLTACSDNSQREKEQAARRAAAELAVMRDLSRAGPEIEGRLRKRIQSSGSIILVKEDFGSLHAMPSTVGWTATCDVTGLGLSIAAAGQEKGVDLQISYAFFEEADCMKLLPLTAAKVTDILAGK
jgi:hypothetical protein